MPIGARPTTQRWDKSTLSKIRGKKAVTPHHKKRLDPKMGALADYFRQEMRAKLVEHQEYIRRPDEDLPEVRDWKWDL
jgi:phosphoketolase